MIEVIENEQLSEAKIKLFVLRLDKLPQIPSGNKYFKLKYNMEQALKQKAQGLLTFGGAFSNHILATAQAAAVHNLPSVGIIRGEQPLALSATLQDAQQLGMRLVFISRNAYQTKNTPQFLSDLQVQFPNFYILPEGGTNEFALQGTAQIAHLLPFEPHFLACSIGTGGTLAGLCIGAKPQQKILGFSALKGDFIVDEVLDLLQSLPPKSYAIPQIFTQYHCGGYAKTPDYLMDFVVDFYQNYHIALEPIYTAKMFYGLFDLIQKRYFPENSTIVALHTGGLQALRGKPTLLQRMQVINPHFVASELYI